MIMVNSKNETPWHIFFAVEVITIVKFYANLDWLVFYYNLDRFMIKILLIRLNKTPKSHFSNVCGCLDEKPWDDVIFGRGKKEEEEHLLKKKVS